MRNTTLKKILFAAALLFIGGLLAAESQIIVASAVASFYGDEYHGRPTSSGEIFDMNALTAAHKTLPFGTMLEVTNLENNRTVIVRINDRGPYIEGREIDLSKEAASRLDMLSTGTARVSLRRVNGLDAAAASAAAAPAMPDPVPPAAATPRTAPAANGSSTSKSTSAPAAVATPAAEPVSPPAPQAVSTPARPVTAPATAPAKGPAWRIQMGSFSQEQNATRLVIKLRSEGFDPAFERSAGMIRVVIAGVEDRDLAAMRERLSKAGYVDYLIRQERW